ncbi:Splicing factor 3B subunit 6-like protein [Neolecta irregularis DAH-3]|uniref:Splicing factor 3B subunit 6-like protein n=1 Tax=Neolecta irregularis (strain DAH-3) TaxID=1198029 RepID=A0A1U7LJ25_NEOID|nr:Splicing factor 3B subunit 6-like protein [Neolecta irregularis DAH-3]|eukprot:OLL22628.1 Splicing factor 3B subunit 6-like protein [Neolecta irregularis DAH-3]
MFDLFGKYGPIRQIRLGNASTTKGTAFVVFEDVMDAKMACEKLNGFNFMDRYLVVLFHQPEKSGKPQDLAARQAELDKLKSRHGRLEHVNNSSNTLSSYSYYPIFVGIIRRRNSPMMALKKTLPPTIILRNPAQGGNSYES